MAVFSSTQFQILTVLWTFQVKKGTKMVPRHVRVNHRPSTSECTITRAQPRCDYVWEFLHKPQIRIILRFTPKCHRQLYCERSSNPTLPSRSSIATTLFDFWHQLNLHVCDSAVKLITYLNKVSCIQLALSFFQPSFGTDIDHNDTHQYQAAPHPRSTQLSPSLVGALTSD